MAATTPKAARPLPRWAVVLFLLLILALAASFRFYRFGQVPPGPHYDEASKLFDALDVLAGRETPFSLRPYGREMLHVYVAAPLVALLGPTHLALRLPTAFLGILTPLAIYLFVQELLGQEDKRKAQWTGLLAALFLALSFWYLAVNRLGFRANYVPLAETLCFLFFWRALRLGRWWDYALSGFFLGVGLNTYINSRFVPLVLVVFLAIFCVTRQGRAQVVPRWKGWLLLGFVALLVFGPLLTFFLTHPGTFMLRAGGVSIFNPALQRGDPWGLVKRSVLGNLGLFGFTGDPSWQFNIPGRPALDAVQAILFWMGMALCLVRGRRPRYAFLLVWWLIMLLPGILAPDPIPHFLRALGVLPVACIISGLALAELLAFASQRVGRLRPAFVVAVVVVVLSYSGWAGYRTWHNYFDVWAQRDEVYYAYYGHMSDLAGQINRETDPNAVYLVPINHDRYGEEYHEYSLELLHQGPVPFHYVMVDDATVVRDLEEAVRGKERVHLVVWTHGEHVDADPRGILPFYLERAGVLTGEQSLRGYRILTYDLSPGSADVAAPLDFAAAEADFSRQVHLTAQAHAPSAPSGGAIWMALRWKVEQPPPADYKVSLRLLDPYGHMVGQSDSLLLSNEHRLTFRWEPGQEVTSYHLVHSLPATMPGTYQLQLLLYDPNSMQPVPLVDRAGTPVGDELLLGPVEVSRPLRPAVAEPQTRLDDTHLTPDLELLGFDLDRAEYAPGETMDLSLYWHAEAKINQDYGLAVQLMGPDGKVAAEWSEELSYPTSYWQADDLWRHWLALRIPADTPPATYNLLVGVTGEGMPQQPAEAIARIEVQGRPHRFEVPAMGHLLPARLGDGIELLGYDLAEEHASAGGTLHLTLYWRALSESDTPYTVFTHLLDDNGRIVGQSDSVPAGGSAPTTGWVRGEVIVDEHGISISPDAAPGVKRIEVGMYHAGTGQRLPVFGRDGQPLGDRLLLDSLIPIE